MTADAAAAKNPMVISKPFFHELIVLLNDFIVQNSY